MRRVLLTTAALTATAGAACDATYNGANSTAYCLRGRMADGSQTRARSVAMNSEPLGARIRIVGRPAGPGGLRLFTVRDRIGHGSELDFWTSTCAAAVRWGRRLVHYKHGWAKP